MLVAQCLTLCNRMDCSLPGFSVHRDYSGKNTEVGCHFLLQGIFLTQGSNLSLLCCRQILDHLSHREVLTLEGLPSEWEGKKPSSVVTVQSLAKTQVDRSGPLSPRGNKENCVQHGQSWRNPSETQLLCSRNHLTHRSPLLPCRNSA